MALMRYSEATKAKPLRGLRSARELVPFFLMLVAAGALSTAIASPADTINKLLANLLAIAGIFALFTWGFTVFLRWDRRRFLRPGNGSASSIDPVDK